MNDIPDKFPFDDANAEQRPVRAHIRSIENALRFGRQGEVLRIANLLGGLVDELRRAYIKESDSRLIEEAGGRAPALAPWPAMVARIEALQGMVRDKPKEERVSKSLAEMIERALLDVASLAGAEEASLSSARVAHRRDETGASRVTHDNEGVSP